MFKKSFVVVIFFVLCIGLFSPSVTQASANNVSVKLLNYLGNKKEVSVSIIGEYSVTSDSTKLTSGKNYNVKLISNNLVLFESSTQIKNYGNTFTVQPKQYSENNIISINGKKYLGTVQFTIENGYIRPINTLPLEDYLKGVVPREMPASWGDTGGLEALKAQSVAARTYTIAKINSVLVDTVSNQVYGGYDWHPNTNKAVNETSGQVIKHGGKLISSAVYSASNGGYTVSNSDAWGSAPVPYLIAQEDKYDTNYSWNLTINKQQINMSGKDLSNPNTWWNSVTEVNKTEMNNIKNWIKSNGKVGTETFNGTDIRIVDIPLLQVSTKKNSSQKNVEGSITVDFFVRNSDGSYRMADNSQSNPANYIKELSGETRYDTSSAIANYGWSTGVDAVVLGRGDIPVDALTGSVLAKKHNSPLLLTQSSKIPTSVLNQIKKLNPKKIYIMGGNQAISNSVLSQLKQYNPERIGGATRYETSVNIAQKITGSNEVIITSGDESSPDALTIASYAGQKQIPILLTRSNALSDTVKQYLRSKSISKVYIIGGNVAISKNIENEIKGLGITNIERVQGADRYETSIKIADRFSFNLSNILFARGDLFIDALPGAALAAKLEAPVILTRKDRVPPVVNTWLASKKGKPVIHYLGGTEAIKANTRAKINQLTFADIKKYRLQLQNTSVGTLRSMIGGTIFKSHHITKSSVGSSSFTIEGKGYGHGVGMSQHGAYARAKDGKNYKDILGFYYNGVTIEPY